jgi:hypothetical protein
VVIQQLDEFNRSHIERASSTGAEQLPIGNEADYCLTVHDLSLSGALNVAGGVLRRD